MITVHQSEPRYTDPVTVTTDQFWAVFFCPVAAQFPLVGEALVTLVALSICEMLQFSSVTTRAYIANFGIPSVWPVALEPALEMVPLQMSHQTQTS